MNLTANDEALATLICRKLFVKID